MDDSRQHLQKPGQKRDPDPADSTGESVPGVLLLREPERPRRGRRRHNVREDVEDADGFSGGRRPGAGADDLPHVDHVLGGGAHGRLHRRPLLLD